MCLMIIQIVAYLQIIVMVLVVLRTNMFDQRPCARAVMMDARAQLRFAARQKQIALPILAFAWKEQKQLKQLISATMTHVLKKIKV